MSRVPAQRRFNWPEQDGLDLPWSGNTYFNCPYKDLEEWLGMSCYMQGLSAPEQIGLFPVRPNRVWWCKYMSTIPTVVAWLKPLKFVGFKSGFPAPLVLVYTGANTEAFRKAVEPLSTFVGGRLN